MKTVRVWSKEEPFGTELAEVTFGDNTLSAIGVAIGMFTVPGSHGHKSPYRADYRLTTVERFVTSRLVLRTEGEGWKRSLDLRRLASGLWKCTTETHGEIDLPPPGGDLGNLSDALDCDIAFSPLTNTMPVLRSHFKHGSEPAEVTVAWVSLPDLSVTRATQRYEFLHKHGPHETVVRFTSKDTDQSAEVTVDERGLVVDFPGIGKQVK